MMRTALVVDDSALARLTLKRYLEKSNIEVFEAECVADCRSWLMHNQIPDVVFMDISMPGEDGFDGLADIRANKDTRDLPVIMYSGEASEQAKQKAREGRATGFLRKPVNEAHLKTLLDKLSKLHKPQPQPQPVEIQLDSINVNVVEPDIEPIPVPVNTPKPTVDEHALQDIRQHIGRLNIALERQQEELLSAKDVMQRQSNDLAHLQTKMLDQDKRVRMIAIMGIFATLAAVIAIAAAFIY